MHLEDDHVLNFEHESFENTYFEACSSAYDIVEQHTEPQVPSPQRLPVEEATHDKGPRVVLPKIQLPEFSGRYEDWIPFRDVFKSLIHKNQSL